MKQFFKRHIRVKVDEEELVADLIDAKNGIYEVKEYFWYTIRYRGITYKFMLPPGFRTNFASVPKWAWWAFHPTENQMLIASCVHDFILNEQRQKNLLREVIVDGQSRQISEVIDGFLAADLFFFALSQEGSYNLITRQFLRLCVKGYYFCTLKGWVSVK